MAVVLRSQPGPQTEYLRSKADFTIFGGAAGGGKTAGSLLAPLRYIAVKPTAGYNCVFFRRTLPQIKQKGGLWEESFKFYESIGGQDRPGDLEWRWDKLKSSIAFRGLQHVKDMYRLKGAQMAEISIEELTEFEEEQIWYLYSRNRSTCGIIPRMRGTTNPDADSYVKKLVLPWIKTADWPEEDRTPYGEVRFMYRGKNDEYCWRKRGEKQDGDIGITFIFASLQDNKILMQEDPNYINKLKALSYIERERLLYSNWDIRPKAGLYFKKHYFHTVESVPDDIIRTVRYWDLAATEFTGSNNPDYTVGTLLGQRKDNSYVVLDVIRERKGPSAIEEIIKAAAESDTKKTPIYFEQEGGASSIHLIDHYRRNVLAGFKVNADHVTGSKEIRCRPASALAEQGKIAILKSNWNDAWLSELEAFPTKNVHDDTVDSLSGAISKLSIPQRAFEEEMAEWLKPYAIQNTLERSAA